MQDMAGKYADTVEENRRLYNEVQDLKGNIRVFCRIRPPGTTGDQNPSCLDTGVDGEVTAPADVSCHQALQCILASSCIVNHGLKLCRLVWPQFVLCVMAAYYVLCCGAKLCCVTRLQGTEGIFGLGHALCHVPNEITQCIMISSCVVYPALAQRALHVGS